MNKVIATIMLFPVALTMFSCNASGNNLSANSNSSDTVIQEAAYEGESSDSITPLFPAGVVALMESYPDFIIGYEEGNLILKDGTRVVYDDGKSKSFEEMLDNSDPEDMFFIKYVEPENEPEYLADSGRSRCELLFKKMYGNSAAAVQKKLVSVDWFGQKVSFTAINGAADSLRKVAVELKQYPELRKYLKSSGTFYWRTVRGAKRQSAHSYGIAFDIGVSYSDYWKWKNPNASETAKIRYSNKIPKKIVEIFRRHGFIWGGSWYHFDTMHFEFRPELLKFAEMQ